MTQHIIVYPNKKNGGLFSNLKNGGGGGVEFTLYKPRPT